VAYVLGQLQSKTALATLSKVLRDVNEHPMVRHEAAEALGSIAGIFPKMLSLRLQQSTVLVFSLYLLFTLLGPFQMNRALLC